MFTLYWIREDGHGDYDMGSYKSRQEAEAAIDRAQAELIDQCPGPHVDTNTEFTRCRDQILAGKWSIQQDGQD